ncbi:MAG: beta-ketoacyl synthase N-terminal-like domain-containing protein [Bacillota bacterium]|nr:beta-ketoacyl synthase N-terminal-like domain-containing protein [Bacillota bacterium]
MKKRIVITGLGVVCPAGIGKNEFWNNIESGKNNINSITRFDTSDVPVKLAGEVNNFVATEFLNARWVKKSDRFSHFAFAATKLAIEDSKLDLQNEDAGRIGVSIGNNVGGWELGERGLYELYRDGSSYLNPYQASAWFPAAAQGIISIVLGVKGISKTTVADRASGMMAIGLAMRMIATGQADIMITGGTEAPLSQYSTLVYYSSGQLSEEADRAKAYTPFNKGAKGIVMSEGSGIVILEEYEHAVKRGAHIYGELLGYATCTDYVSKSGKVEETLSKAILNAMKNAGVMPPDIDYICADGGATDEEALLETNAIKIALKDRASQIPISVPKSMFGHLYGGASPVDLISTLMAMENNAIPPTINFVSSADGCDLDYTPNVSSKCNIENALINSRSYDGINASIIVRKFK